MIWQVVTAMLHSDEEAEERRMETEKGCQKPALHQKASDNDEVNNKSSRDYHTWH